MRMNTLHLLLWFMLGSFASHRIALMVTKEDGPAWVFRKIRNLPDKKSSAHAGMRCIWCGSVWSAGLMSYLSHWTIDLQWSEWIIFWLAMSSGAIAINQQWTKG